jgi:hypothetical protein
MSALSTVQCVLEITLHSVDEQPTILRQMLF